ncbi:cupin domain-containing protein [uncultured Tateyamaria sp.]|uniref:cupin domain-containing protein n=1 Tax=uncultured Tateyamaria sp. TaxID=455651 RepID=UPI00260A1059|nr:cupin domain-containing protein [uncultured Tateyamaria sp.]
MKRLVFTGIALLMAGTAWAQEIAREEIRRVDVPGSDTMEVVVFRLTVPVGATIPLHTHPGDEHTVVVTDARAEAPNGNIVEFAVGTPLYFPEGQVHGGLTNVGDAPMVAITTFVVRKGEPLTVLAN